MISTQPQEDAPAEANDSATTGAVSSWRSRGYYLIFATFALLALYTQIAVVHPTNVAWHEVTLEVFGYQHAMAQDRHERLARKFRLKAHSDAVEGTRARIKAAEGDRKGHEDAQNATKMLQLAGADKKEAIREQHEAEALRDKASGEHKLFLEYLKNASLHEQRAEELKEEAARYASQSKHYRKIFDKYSSMAHSDEELREAYLQNATYEAEVEQNITEAEENKEDQIWICRWGWSRQYVCGVFGGFTALGEADKWHEKEIEDIQHAADLQQQILVEQAKAMIASTQAARTDEEARLARLRAEEMHNATILDGIRAYEEQAKELKDLQQELQDLALAEEHLQKLKHYQALGVQLEAESRKEEEYSRGEWKVGSDLLNKAGKEQKESDRQSDLAKDEEEKQRELVERANELGRRLRLFSSVAAACALISFAFFAMAVVTTNTLSLGYQVKLMAVAFSVTVSRHWEGRNTNWEGRSILGDHQDRNCLRQISCWFHHCLCFLVVAGIQGEDLSSIYMHDSWTMRGDILLKFAVSAGCLEALLFQAVPQVIFLTPEYFRNVVIRLGASTFQFAIQMLLLLILCGEDSIWFSNRIVSLHRYGVYWIMALTITWLAHMFFIECPYASSLDRNSGAMSDMTFSTYTTCGETTSYFSGKASRIKGRMCDVDEEVQLTKQPTIADLPHRHVNINNNHNSDETDSLLTVSHAAAPAFASTGSLPYSSISVLSTPTTQSASNHPISPPSPALQRLYEVSIQNEFFVILSHIELLLLTGVLLVLCASLPHIAHR